MSFIKYLAEELAGKNKVVDEQLEKFIIDSLNFVAQLHLYHLVTKSHAEHVAIGEFYDGLQLKIDAIAEQSIGIGIKLSGESRTNTLSFQYNKSTLLAQLNTYRDSLSILIDETESSSIMSINDSLISTQVLIDSVLYKLQLS